MSKPIKYKAPKRGTVVYDVADPRHHGIVKSLHLHDGKFCASVKWIDGWHSTRVPVANLRRVTADTPSEPDRARPVLKLKRRARQIGFGASIAVFPPDSRRTPAKCGPASCIRDRAVVKGRGVSQPARFKFSSTSAAC